MAKQGCKECSGTGYELPPPPGFTMGRDCPVCKGEGWVYTREPWEKNVVAIVVGILLGALIFIVLHGKVRGL